METKLTIDNVKFAQLHCHNFYSIKDSRMTSAEMINRAKELNYYAIAETNHGKMYGSYEFFKNCTATKDKYNNPLTPIKPIVGVEAYVTPSLEFLHNKENKKRYFHLILLCKNYDGYVELCCSTRKSEKQIYKGKPCLTHEDLETYLSNGNIICLSACIGGEVQQLILQDEMMKAKETIEFYKRVFKGEFYMELQNHGIEAQQKLIPLQVKLAKECGIKCVITSDAHFARKEDKKYHDILMCMQFSKKLDEYTNDAYTENHYMKSKEELFKDFRFILKDDDILEALNNTGLIADKCNFEFNKENHYPKYHGSGKTVYEILKEEAYKGLENIPVYNSLSDKGKDKYKARLEDELYVIKKTGYSDYFLIVSDLIKHYNAKINGYSGLGRGSGVGSLVAYSLDITKVDPIQYNLYFDRFLNLERVSPPDFDLDFDNLREEIFKYSTEKYGDEKTCKIITFGKMAAKGAIRAVGRVLNTPLYVVDKVAKTIKGDTKATIKSSLDKLSEYYSVELENLYNEDEKIRELVDIAEHFEGIIDHTGSHAAACIIADKDVSEYIPLQWDSESNMWISQFYKDYNEELGLLKMDYLGLNNLTVIKETARLVNKKYKLNLGHNEIINLAIKNYKNIIKEIYAKGKTKLIFQFESAGMRDTLLKFNPTTIEDLVLLNAVYRPGPLQYIDKIIYNKQHKDEIKYDHECLKPILDETYGYPVYQEQIMAIFRAICGYSLGQADTIRRAMGKKKMNLIENARKDFVEGYKKLGLSEEKANGFFDEIMEFAKYSFNKSHAVAYTITSLETGYLKLYYPQEYMTACLSYNTNKDAYPMILEECKKMGLSILPPSVNKSEELFMPEKENGIRFGLSCVKNVGKSAKYIVQNRPYKDYVDFVLKVSDIEDINKGKIESLAYAGAFDELGVNRATAIYNIPLIQELKKAKKKVDKNQIDFFSMGIEEVSNNDIIKINNMKEMPYTDKMEQEYEMLFSYVSGHPLNQYRRFIDSINKKEFINLEECDNNKSLDVVARIKEITILYRKKDNAPMAKIILEDLTGNLEGMVFTKNFNKFKDKLVKGKVFKFNIATQIYVENEVLNKSCIINNITDLAALDTVYIKIPSLDFLEKDIIKHILKDSIGGTQIIFYVENEKKILKTNYLIDINNEIEEAFGKNNIAS